MEGPSKVTRLLDLIAFFLPDYLRLVEPDLVAHLDLSNVELLHLPFASQTVIGEVSTRGGKKVTVLVRVELEAASNAAVGEDLARSLRALQLPLGEPVWLSSVFLRGSRPGVNLETAPAVRLAGLDVVRLYYLSFGLTGSRAEYYLERPEPLAWALSALMSPSRGRADHQRNCKARIRASGLDDDCREFLLACVESFQADAS